MPSPILHLIDTTGPGGAETVFLNLAHGMRDRGWESHVVVIGPGWVLDQVERAGLPVTVVETRGKLDFGYLMELVKVVRHNRIRLIHAHLFSPAVYASMVGTLTRVPVVATFHGSSDTNIADRSLRLRFRLIASAATVVCVSEALRAELDNGLGRSRGVHVIHNGVDQSAFYGADGAEFRRSMGIPHDAILIGALGNLRPAKDFANFLRAAALLAADRRMVFAIAGECSEPWYGELLQLRRELDLDDRFSFLGFTEDPASALAAFDVLAISSSSEGFSLAAIQAMAAGTPVVATRSGGPDQIITDGVDGLLVPVGHSEALANAVRTLVNDDGLRVNLISSARQTVARRFSLGAMLDGYETLYSQLLGGVRVR